MSGSTIKKLKRKAFVDFYAMKKRHPELTFKRFFLSVKRLYLRGEIKLA